MNRSRHAPHRAPPTAVRGFTLIELVMVMAIVGALAWVAMPRLLDLTMWRARAYADELQAELLAMRRLALAQRRPVTATLSTTGATFTYADGGGSLGHLACPATISPCLSAASAGSITFNAAHSGAASTSSGVALTVTVAAGSYAQSFALEHETGLIRRLP
jgi:prepilin-type N-terminal cleavage/methylation domain-containing protein